VTGSGTRSLLNDKPLSSLLKPAIGLELYLRRVPSRTWSYSVSGLYICVIGVVLFQHVLWRDEAQMWLIARASQSLSDLWSNLEYENRPILWFLTIWPLSRLSSNPELIKIPTLAASAFTALIITRFMPLARVEQLALLSGFIFLLGYSTTSTGYMPGILLLLLWFVAYANRNYFLQYVFLVLAANVHFLFLLMATPFWLMTTVDFVRARSLLSRKVKISIAGIGVLSALGFIFSAWMTKPPSDYGYVWIPPAATTNPISAFVEYLSMSLRNPGLALPRVLTSIPIQIWFLVLVGLCLFALLLIRFRAIAPVCALGLIGLNGVYGYGPFWWHSGVVVVALVLLVSITRKGISTSWIQGFALAQTVLFGLILVTQVVVSFSIPGSLLWGKVPYSGSKQAATSIQEICSSCNLVTDSDLLITGVSAYLGGASFYAMNVDRAGTFTVWDTPKAPQPEVTWSKVRDVLRDSGEQSIAVLTSLQGPPADFEVLQLTQPSAQVEEQFLVVRLRD
jgi:hypothetical protein